MSILAATTRCGVRHVTPESRQVDLSPVRSRACDLVAANLQRLLAGVEPVTTV
jgi:hypothetical protein